MSTNRVLFVDENNEQRRIYALSLKDLFADSGLSIEAIAPLPQMNDYAALLADGSVIGLILDQKMEDGGVGYTGTELSAFLRGILPKLPIVILSNFTGDVTQFEKEEDAVEYIISKDTMEDPAAHKAQTFKARFLRRLAGYSDVVGARAKRYHALLVKSLKEKLTAAEEIEIGVLETERILPQQAKELGDIKKLEALVAEFKMRLGSDESQ